MKKHFGKFVCAILAFALIFCAIPLSAIKSLKAESLTLSSLLENYGQSSSSSQEITSSLGFVTDFGDAAGSETKEGWTTPSFTSQAITEVGVADLTSTTNIGYTTEGDITFADLGTDGQEGNKYGLFLIQKTAGIAAIDSPEISVPAHALYVLTFNVKIGKVEKSKGLNACLIDQDGTIYSKKAITSTSGYETFCFLIEGNQYETRSFKLRLMLGLYKEEDSSTTKNEEQGYAVVDTIRLFSVTREQFTSLSDDTDHTTKVWLSKINSSYVTITNGTFNSTNNKNWNMEENTALSDLAPTDWTQTGAANSTYGVVNTKSEVFSERMAQLGLEATNPEDGTMNSNVLMLYNSDFSNQTITSSSIKMSSNYVYEISFRFNTPATPNQTNGLSFYVVDDDDKTIYSKENIFSYEQYSEDANEWATFRLFIMPDSSLSDVKFIIKFGTESKTAKGIAYVDDVLISDKRDDDSAFVNHLENTFELTKENETDETTYLAKGTVSFDDLKELDLTKSSNRTLWVYDYSDVEEDSTEDDTSSSNKNDEDDEEEDNSAVIWYVIPSVLLGVCLIAGIVIYYCKKIKIKKHPRKKKTSYDRKKTLNKQVEKRERETEKANKK